MVRRLLVVLCLGLFCPSALLAKSSECDSLPGASRCDSAGGLRFSYRQVVLPSVLIGYGAAGFRVDAIKRADTWLKGQVGNTRHRQVRVDDYLQYAPAVAVYALGFSGVEGKHSLVDKSVVLGASLALVSLTVVGLKNFTNVRRPDGSATNSFPSGHTATAFMCAEFLHQEYKEQSVWYSVAAYTAATATGALRVYNVRHWLSDVVAGAGIGIAATKIAYWAFPHTKRLYSPRQVSSGKASAVLLPYHNGNNLGVGLAVCF